MDAKTFPTLMGKPTYGQLVRMYREFHGITLRDLGDKTGLDFTYLSRIENGHYAPSESAIQDISNALEIDVPHIAQCLIAGKIPEIIQRDLLERNEWQVTALFQAILGNTYTHDEWELVLVLLRKDGDR